MYARSSGSDDNKAAPNTHSNPSKMIMSTLELRLRIVFHSRLVGESKQDSLWCHI